MKKNIYSLSALLILSFLIFNFKKESTQNIPEMGYVFCDRAVIVDSTGNNIIAIATFGDKITLLQDTIEYTSGETFVTILLPNKTQGWIDSRYILPANKAAITLHNAQTCQNPDQPVNNFVPVTIKPDLLVQVIDTVNGAALVRYFVNNGDKPFYGYNDVERKYKKKWIGADNISYNKDIVDANFLGHKILNTADSITRLQLIDTLISRYDTTHLAIYDKIMEELPKRKIVHLKIHFENITDNLDKTINDYLEILEFNPQKNEVSLEFKYLKKYFKELFRFDTYFECADYLEFPIGFPIGIVPSYRSSILLPDQDLFYRNSDEKTKKPNRGYFIKAFMRETYRDSAYLSYIYSHIKQPLFTHLNNSYFNNFNIDDVVNELLRLYDSLTQKPDYYSKLNEIYLGLSRQTNYKEGVYKLHQLYGEEIDITNYYHENDLENWYKSFWVRRAAEGNIYVVHAILKDLQKFYNQKK